jgi:hypothetical protein
VALDPSGMYAATCSFDKLVRVFDFFSGAAIAKVPHLTLLFNRKREIASVVCGMAVL